MICEIFPNENVRIILIRNFTRRHTRRIYSRPWLKINRMLTSFLLIEIAICASGLNVLTLSKSYDLTRYFFSHYLNLGFLYAFSGNIIMSFVVCIFFFFPFPAYTFIYISKIKNIMIRRHDFQKKKNRENPISPS